ncbi:hypothetical protein [Luteolibacter sp. Populi]|uniref:hypothetical protein n=1 Tax=Luteolibacter sp. Populi TaxID=3230487 RepID=UPI003467EC97
MIRALRPLPLAIGAAIAFTMLPVSAPFEKWTGKDGKTAELELVGVEGDGAETSVEFRTKAGRTLTLPSCFPVPPCHNRQL